MPRSYKSALVTGATSGIGEAFARRLARTTDLMLTGRNADGLARLQAELSGTDRMVRTVAADLATPADLERLLQEAALFRPELLICNAGLGPYGRFLEADEAMIHDTVAVNVMAPTILTRRLLGGMIDRARAAGRRAGLIIVSSGVAFLPVPGLAVYAASKAFDLSLAEALAAELVREPVDVLALCPTATRSRFAARSGWVGGSLPGAQGASYVARAALNAIGRQRTLVMGPISGTLLTGTALARAAAARAIALLTQR